jgi:hypothetical protein
MVYNILGTFAQVYREQLAENVRMGMAQGVREGKWINRPKKGYDLVAGELIPNGDALTIHRIFELRTDGASYHEIERQTGVKYSTGQCDLEVTHLPGRSVVERRLVPRAASADHHGGRVARGASGRGSRCRSASRQRRVGVVSPPWTETAKAG